MHKRRPTASLGVIAVLALAGCATTQVKKDFDPVGEPVTVRVTNDNWLDMRIYVVETATGRRRWRLGDVTALSTARFEIPDHLGAELGNLVLVAEAIGSRERQFTHHLQTWPGALVDWTIGAALGLSYATVSFPASV